MRSLSTAPTPPRYMPSPAESARNSWCSNVSGKRASATSTLPNLIPPAACPSPAVSHPSPTAVGDGWETAGEGQAAGGIKFGSVEVAEARFPLTFEHHEFRADSAGEGMHRGGVGAVLRLRVDIDEPAVANTGVMECATLRMVSSAARTVSRTATDSGRAVAGRAC